LLFPLWPGKYRALFSFFLFRQYMVSLNPVFPPGFFFNVLAALFAFVGIFCVVVDGSFFICRSGILVSFSCGGFWVAGLDMGLCQQPFFHTFFPLVVVLVFLLPRW